MTSRPATPIARAAVYDPPTDDFPYLAAIFLPGRDEPIVMSFETAMQAEGFIAEAAQGLANLATKEGK